MVHRILATMHPPQQMMVLPVRLGSYGLVTDQALACLLQPQIATDPPTRQGVRHLQRPPLLEVGFPARIVGVRRSLHLDVPDDAGAGHLVQVDGVRATLFTRQFAGKYAVTTTHAGEVFRLHPRRGLLIVPPPRPAPQPAKETSVHFGKGTLAGRMPMIV